ncbi:MAG: hypothetical protein CM1200mP28_05060 [Deltaproteobacteria bacterium]|nr:MAG: hypothetical protein CM1200mP28_05060 [Deltaproteobacteria bacterium]
MFKQPENKQIQEQTQILVLDDEPSIRWVMDRTLSQGGYIPRLAADAHVARQLLKKHSIRLAFVESIFPDKTVFHLHVKC